MYTKVILLQPRSNAHTQHDDDLTYNDKHMSKPPGIDEDVFAENAYSLITRFMLSRYANDC